MCELYFHFCYNRDMRFYPQLDLFSHYLRNAHNPILSDRIPDYMIERNMEVLNAAINACETWDSFLDIGAASGRCSAALLTKFKKGIGVDVYPDADLKKLARSCKNFSIVEKPIQKVQLKKTVDFILMMDVFEHFPSKDVQPILKKLARFQKKGGVIYILTPNALVCGPAEKSGIFHTIHPFGHYKHYLPHEVTALLEKVGYTKIIEIYEEHPFKLLMKSLNLGVSYVDTRLTGGVKWLTTPLVWVGNLALKMIGKMVTWNERANRDQAETGRSMVLVYKKN